MSENGWSEYQKLVLHRLDSTERKLVSIESRVQKLSSVVDKHSERMAITAAAFGFIAGIVPSFVAIYFNQ
tara:strand:- start:182 stop:391 length:210 start_codon:yes stop_codon:yes gene_type:complete